MKRILVLKAAGDILLIHAGYLIAFIIRFMVNGEIEAHNLTAYLNVAPWLTLGYQCVLRVRFLRFVIG